jgi:outer membrane protein OmpA-like peptidoglycan-associated protein
MSRRASSKKRQRKESVPEALPTHTRRASPSSPQARVLDLQRSAGNRAVEELLKPNPEGKPHAVENPPPVVQAALDREGGQPLDAATREAMEPILGQDLSQVRVHTDAEAAASAEAVNALAYTAGQDIVFGAGQYAPETSEGRELLTHELGHAVEQGSAGAELGAAIMRAPKSGTADPPSLLASTIPAPSVMRVGGMILATVYFGQNDFLMDAANFTAVEKLADELGFMVKPTIAVDGYASSEGTKEYNLHLSDMRRQAVIAILRSKLTDTADMGGTAHGESDPAVAETATNAKELESQRARNRRVTIFIMSGVTPEPAQPEEKKKPIDLFPHPKIDLTPETDQERFDRMFKQLEKVKPQPRPTTSFSEEFWKGVDKVVDDATKKLGVPEKYRGLIRDGAHALIEKGAEKALDGALDQAKLPQNEKDAIKSAVKAAAQQKF